MSILREAHNFVISGGDFRTETRIHNQYGQSGIDILHEASSPGAAFDSGEHYNRSCFPGTREQYIADIINWATAPDDTFPSIYWMWGPAGVGKSAIAQTCAENLENAEYLGAAFFFTVKKHNNPLRLFTTIAYQLAIANPDYRTVLDNKISMDKTIVGKRLSSQFKRLIVEPLQELEKQGKRIGKRAVFIDGLDECAVEEAQTEIIEIIASSVRAGSTPFRWAVFSRSEPRIVLTFNRDDITSITHSVELPISHKASGEIELYLRGEFRNILQRQNGFQLLSSWPTNEDIKTLVDAAAGLFAHPAAVLRFVGYPSDWQFQERLSAVIDTILHPGKKSSTSSLPELDALYSLIMSRIPDDILMLTQLFLYWIAADMNPVDRMRVTMPCCQLGFSESEIRRICHLLHAVIAYQEFPEFNGSLFDPRVNLTRSFYEQGQWFQPNFSSENQLLRAHGLLSFHHKSFFDFLIDPTRSSIFCITTSTIRERFYERCIQQHHHYASSYVIDGSSASFPPALAHDSLHTSELALAPNVASSSASLSWSKGTEFVDSFLKLSSFSGLSSLLSRDDPGFYPFIRNVPLNVLQQLAELDYRKSLIAGRMEWEWPGWIGDVVVAGIPGVARLLPHSIFECTQTNKFDEFRPAEFLSMLDKLRKAGVIRPYHPWLGSSRATFIFRTFSRTNPNGRSHGLYKMGHGDKSVIWYWEFDMEKRYFHNFTTIDYTAAMEFYKANKFTMWGGSDDEEGSGNKEGSDEEVGDGSDENGSDGNDEDGSDGDDEMRISTIETEPGINPTMVKKMDGEKGEDKREKNVRGREKDKQTRQDDSGLSVRSAG